MSETPEKILVRGLNWLGDAIMSTPALQRLREARPSARITMLSSEKLAGLWQEQPFVDEVLTFSESENIWIVSRRLREGKFAAAVAFPNSIRSALELWLAGIPARIGLARRGRGLFLTRALPPRPDAVPMRKRSAGEIRRLIAADAPPPAAPIPPAAHHIHDYLYLTKELGASAEPLPPRIVVSDTQMAQFCQKFSLPAGRPWFGLNPGAEYGPAKRWPADRFAAAARLLQEKTNCRWLIFGGPGDVAAAEQIAAEIRRGRIGDGDAITLAGKTNLRELAAALRLCRLLLTNDTGPMHLGAAVGTPVIVPFGSTSPELTGPNWSPLAQIVRANVPCAPCFLRECPIDLRCLNGIRVEQVVEAAQSVLKGKSTG